MHDNCGGEKNHWLQELSQMIVDALVRECIRFYRKWLVSIAVFGSVGRGTHGYTSDVDLLLVVDGLPRERIKRIREFDHIENSIECLLVEAHDNGWMVLGH